MLGILLFRCCLLEGEIFTDLCGGCVFFSKFMICSVQATHLTMSNREIIDKLFLYGVRVVKSLLEFENVWVEFSWWVLPTRTTLYRLAMKFVYE